MRCCNLTDSDHNRWVANPDEIQIDLIKLADGSRLLRLTEPKSGLTLERKLSANGAVHEQKEALLSVFEAALKKRAEVSVP